MLFEKQHHYYRLYYQKCPAKNVPDSGYSPTLKIPFSDVTEQPVLESETTQSTIPEPETDSTETTTSKSEEEASAEPEGIYLKIIKFINAPILHIWPHSSVG